VKLVAALWYGKEDPRNTSLRLKLSNTYEQEQACLVAIKKAARNAGTHSLLQIETDCENTVEILTTKIQILEDQGFLLTPHTKQLQATVAELRRRKYNTTFLYSPRRVKDPNMIDELNLLLLDAVNLADEIEDDLQVDPTMKLTGAKLCSLNQADTYKCLKALKMKNYPGRRQTKENIKMVLKATQQHLRVTLKEEDIWRSFRHRDLPRTTRSFLDDYA
jgi:hypothetical protein